MIEGSNILGAWSPAAQLPPCSSLALGRGFIQVLITHKHLKNSYGVAFSKQKDKLQLVGIHLTWFFSLSSQNFSRELISIVWKDKVHLMKLLR